MVRSCGAMAACISASVTEQRRTDPDMRRPHGDGRLEIPAHAHRELLHARLAPQHRKMREIAPRRQSIGGDAHQPRHIEAMHIPTALDERHGLVGSNSRLLRLEPDIDLHIDGQMPLRLLHLLAQRRSKFLAVHGLDHIEELHRFPRLVALQRTDQV